MKKANTSGNRIARTLARPFLWLITSAVPVFIAACYGAYYDYEYEMSRAGGRVLDKESGQGISNIEVSCITPDDYVFSNARTQSPDGYFSIEYDPQYPCEHLLFEDVDGEENGEYKTLEVPFDPRSGELVVELEPEN